MGQVTRLQMCGLQQLTLRVQRGIPTATLQACFKTLKTGFTQCCWNFKKLLIKASSTLHKRNFKTEVSPWKRIKCFPSTLRRRNWKTQQTPVSLDLCLTKTGAEKSRDYSDVIIFEKPRFQNVCRPRENERLAFSNSFGLKSVFKTLRFRDGLVWTVAAFSNFSGVVWLGVIPRRRMFH